MCTNLKKLMECKSLKIKDLADFLNITPKTVTEKINQNSDWTYTEAMKIKKFLFPEYELDYIFATE